MNLVLEMRRTCIVFLVTLLLLVSSLIPVTIPVIADEDSPMFTEEDCECAAVGMEMISSSAQSTMFGARFKMDDGLSPRLNYETWWFPNPEFSREKYARYLDPDVGFANVAYMRKSVNEGIEKGFNHVIFEDDFANKNERASFIYGPDSGDLEGKRVFIYDDMYITNITAKYFQSESEIKRAMDALEKCIRAVLERKQQGVAATPQEEKEQEGTLTFKHYHPFPLLLEKESLRMPLHGPGALIATLEDENGEGIPDKQVYFFVEPGSNLAECFRSAPDDIWRTYHPDLKTVGYGYNYTDKDGTAYVNYLTSDVLDPDGLFKVLTRDGKTEGTISAVVLKPGSDEEFEYKQSIPVAFECIAKVVGTTGEVMIRNREYIGNTTGEGYVNATAGYSLMPADSIKINPGASVEIVWLNGNRAIAKVPKVMLVEGSGYVETKPQKLYLLATAYDSGFKSPFDRTSEWINGVVLSEAIDFIIQKIPLAKTIKGYAENLWAGKDKVIELMTNTDEAGLKGNTTTRIRVHSTVLVHQTGDRTEIYTIEGAPEVETVTDQEITLTDGQMVAISEDGSMSKVETFDPEADLSEWAEEIAYLEERAEMERSPSPEPATESDSGSGSNAAVIIVPIVIAAIAAVAFVFFRRRVKTVPVSPIPAHSNVESSFCNQCGNQVPSDAAFCKKCGSKIGS